MYPATTVKNSSTICTTHGTMSPNLHLGAACGLTLWCFLSYGLLDEGGLDRPCSDDFLNILRIRLQALLTNQLAEDVFISCQQSAVLTHCHYAEWNFMINKGSYVHRGLRRGSGRQI